MFSYFSIGNVPPGVSKIPPVANIFEMVNNRYCEKKLHRCRREEGAFFKWYLLFFRIFELCIYVLEPPIKGKKRGIELF